MAESLAYYEELLGCKAPRVAEVDRPGVILKSAMLPLGPAGETYLQILEPSEGPGVEELARGGEGTIREIGFQVDDIEELYDRLVAKGIHPVDLQGRAITGKYIQSTFGNRYFLLPRDKTRGTQIEVVQVMT
jgi:hypothetical protein